MARFFLLEIRFCDFHEKRGEKCYRYSESLYQVPESLLKMLISEDLGVIYSTTNYNNLPTLKLNSPQRKLLKQY